MCCQAGLGVSSRSCQHWLCRQKTSPRPAAQPASPDVSPRNLPSPGGRSGTSPPHTPPCCTTCTVDKHGAKLQSPRFGLLMFMLLCYYGTSTALSSE